MLAGHGPGHGQCLRSRVHQSLLVSHHKCAQHSIASARRRAHQCRVSARESGKACRGSHLQETSSFSRDEEDEVSSFREGVRLPTQGESLVRGVDTPALQLKERERDDGPPDFMFLSELMAMQENGPRNLGFFGTRNMGFMHQNLIEVLSYAMVLTGNHIFTSGATGTNAAVIRGALRAEKPDLLTVVLPQSLQKQPPESQDLLAQVKAENLISMPQNDELTLAAASRICNRDIVNRVQQVICFAFHDSNLLLETCSEAKEHHKAVTLFYLD